MIDKPIQHGRCSNTSLRALGFEPDETCFSGIEAFGWINDARSKGLIEYKIIGQSANYGEPDYMWFGGNDKKATVKRFVETHPKGSYFITTRNHAMALIDGVLTDTENRGPDGRIILSATQIFRKQPEAPKPVEPTTPTDDNDYMAVINTKTGERTGKFSSFKQASSKAKVLTASTGIDHAIGDWIP